MSHEAKPSNKRDVTETRLTHIIVKYIVSLTLDFPDIEFLPDEKINLTYPTYEQDFIAVYLERGWQAARECWEKEFYVLANLFIDRGWLLDESSYNDILRKINDVDKSLLHFVELNLPQLPAFYLGDIRDFSPSDYPPTLQKSKSSIERCNKNSTKFLTGLAESRVKDVKRIISWYLESQLGQQIPQDLDGVRAKRKRRKGNIESLFKTFPIGNRNIEDLHMVFQQENENEVNLVLGQDGEMRDISSIGFAKYNGKPKAVWNHLKKFASLKRKPIKPLNAMVILELNSLLRRLLEVEYPVIVPSGTKAGHYLPLFKCYFPPR